MFGEDMSHTSMLLVLSPVLVVIISQLLPIVIPVVSSFLFKALNKEIEAVNKLNDWVKRLIFMVFNTLLALGITALHLANVSPEIQSWTQTTIEGVLGAVAAMLLYDNGKTAATDPKLGGPELSTEHE
jgi:Na+-transporting methylmalonyl-CoA/oxaloacetate decarboxylase beta subunit